MSAPGENPSEKKIIIDEDWKTQVERERESARGQPDIGSAATTASSPAGQELPGASFEMLLSLFYSPALMALGQFDYPDGSRTQVDLNQARFYIDLLGILAEKIGGGATEHDRQMIQDALDQLRMTYVHVEGVATRRPEGSGPERSEQMNP